MAPPGRPKKDDAKRQRLQIRLSDESAEKLKRCAEALETTKTEVIEWGIDLVDRKCQGKKP